MVPLLLLLLQPISGDQCPGLSDPDVKYFDIRIPDVEVPEEVTTYVCQQFQVPNDESYHAIAFEPLIDNHDVMHHMLLFGCPEDVVGSDPHQCSAVDNRCPSWLTQWTMGVKGQVCAHPGTGIRFGKDSFTHMSLQIHWNNQQQAVNMSDSSGMRIYYTRKLRQHDAGNVQIGQLDLEIPPGSTNQLQAGSCSGNCTQSLFTQPVYLTRTYIHMHYLGTRGVLEVYRDGVLIHTVAEDPQYEYQLSPIHVHHKPVQILPGDEIRLSCFFDTITGHRARNRTVFYGEGSDAEMCFAFVTYYPRVDYFNQCAQFAEYDVCGPTAGSSYGECSFNDFSMVARQSLVPRIAEDCRNETNHVNCGTACASSLHALLAHPCMTGRLGQHARRTILSRLRDWDRISGLLDNTRC